MTEDTGLLAVPPPRYRVLVLGEGGIVLRTEHLAAACDEDAMVLARGMSGRNPVELWDGLRFIEQFALLPEG